ncbi:deoxyribonuclease IV [bacterium]|nr:deoxyribonuclease IV [bacterium]
MKLGCHLSIARGFAAMVQDAIVVKANVFQFFCRNPRGKAPINFTDSDLDEGKILMAQNNIGPILAHGPFIINAASDKEETRSLTEELIGQDIRFMENFEGAMYNFHPGNHLKNTPERGIELVASLLDKVMWPEQETLVLLETMAGKGTELGKNFAQLKEIIARVKFPDKVGVCLDTCHIWDGGYDVVDNLEGVLREFNDILGLERLKAIHLNDSMNKLGAKKDRHAKIGEGKLGLKAIINIVSHPLLRKLPFYLETPNDLDGYAKEIELIRSESAK